MQVKKLKIKLYATIGASAIVFLAVGVFMIYPYYFEVTAATNTLYEARVKLAIYQQQRTNVEQTQRDYSAIKNDISRISKIFVTKQQIFDLISSLEDIAARHHVTQDIKLDPIHQFADQDKILGMSITISGQWQSSVDYLRDLERLDAYILIKDISIEKSTGGVTMILLTEAYSY